MTRLRINKKIRSIILLLSYAIGIVIATHSFLSGMIVIVLLDGLVRHKLD